jgi:hypothetical protein
VEVDALKRKFNKAVLKATGYETGSKEYKVVKSTLSREWGNVLGNKESKRGKSAWMRAAAALAALSPADAAKAIAKSKVLRKAE